MQRALSVYLMSKARGKLVYAMKEHEIADMLRWLIGTFGVRCKV